MAEQGRFRGCQGVRIFWRSWKVEQPLAVVVISHGLGEHGGRYAPLADYLNVQGYSVFAIDHRGHGRSAGKRGDIGRFQYVVEDLGHLISEVVVPIGKPIILLGHSMGGAVATDYSLRNQSLLAGLMLSGPALNSSVVPGAVKIVCSILGKLAPHLPALKIDPTLVSRDPESVKKYIEDPYNLTSSVPIRTIAEMVSAIGELPAQFPRITLPMLILHGEEDQLIPCDASRALHDGCGSQDKTLMVYPELYHEVLNELPEARAQVMADIGTWLAARVVS
ncbi:MAG: alpha/beta hydrolase [Spongiibacteraceae bacterium]